VATWARPSVLEPAREGAKKDVELPAPKAATAKVVGARFPPEGEWERPGLG